MAPRGATPVAFGDSTRSRRQQRGTVAARIPTPTSRGGGGGEEERAPGAGIRHDGTEPPRPCSVPLPARAGLKEPGDRAAKSEHDLCGLRAQPWFYALEDRLLRAPSRWLRLEPFLYRCPRSPSPYPLPPHTDITFPTMIGDNTIACGCRV